MTVWRSWVDGCPEGESAEEMTARVDRLIEKIVKVTQAHHEKDEEGQGDVIVVCHGRKSTPLARSSTHSHRRKGGSTTLRNHTDP